MVKWLLSIALIPELLLPGFLGVVGWLLFIALIIEAPCRNHINREGMGTAVRNVKHTKGMARLVIFKFYLKSEQKQQLASGTAVYVWNYQKTHN